MKKNLLFLIKLAVSVSLLIYIFQKVDATGLVKSLNLLNFYTISLGILIAFVQVFLMSIRWYFIQKSLELETSLKESIAYTWMWHFFSLFLPGGMVGGDLVKGWYMKKEGVHLRVISKVLFMEKVQILLSLLILCLPFLAAYFSQLVFMLGAGGLALVYSGVYIYYKKPYFFQIMMISLLPNVLACVISYLFVINFDPSKTFMAVMQVAPIALLLGAFPISLGGWGVREGAAVYCLSLLEIPTEHALAITLATTTVAVIVSLPGALTWLKIRQKGSSRCAV